jgi:CHAD domain-containing protein
MSASPGRYALLHKRLDRFTQMLQGLGEGDVRALHQTRVASRRLREVLPVLQLDAHAARRLGRRLRKVTQRLGAVRELDVLSVVAQGLAASDRYDTQAVRKLAALVEDQRKRARNRLWSHLPTDELHRIAGKLRRVADDLKSDKPSRGWRWALDARVTRRAQTLKNALTDAGALYLPERLHAVRIALKKLRYAREVEIEAAGAGASTEQRVLKRGQDILGRMHDVQVLIQRARQLQDSLAPGDALLSRKLDTLMSALENDCRRLHARFIHQRPAIAAVCDRALGVRTLVSPDRRAAS